MLPRRVTVPLLAFLLLSGGVAANVFFLQSAGTRFAAREDDDATSWNIAAIEAAEFGDTGSIGRPGAPTAPIGGLDIAALAKADGIAGISNDGNVARAIQRELQIRGYETGARDGVVGSMTRAAILAYEYDHGLGLTAKPSDALLKAIVLGEGGKPGAGAGRPSTAEAQAVIRSVQRSLAKLGYKPGSSSGKLTPATTAAIRAFEADQALPESGRISGPLIARLGRLSDSGRVAVAP